MSGLFVIIIKVIRRDQLCLPIHSHPFKLLCETTDATFILEAHFLYSTYTSTPFIFSSKEQENFEKVPIIHMLNRCVYE